MLDLKFIRDNPELVRQALTNRHDSAPLDEILELDVERRKKISELEDLRQARKVVSQRKGKGRRKRARPARHDKRPGRRGQASG